MTGDLVVAQGPAPTGWSDTDWAAVAGHRVRALTAGTRRQYAADWGAFEGWCRAEQVPSLPATPGTVGRWVATLGGTVRPDGRPAFAVATIRRRLAAVTHAHEQAGLLSPARDPGVVEVMRGVARSLGTRPRRVSPLLLADMTVVLASLEHVAWPAAVASARDAALLVVGWAGAFRRSELSALRLGDLRAVRSDGVHVLVRRSKRDQEGAGLVKALPYGAHALTCPPCALWRWVRLVLAADAAGVGEQRRDVLRVLVQSSTPGERHACRQPPKLPDEVAERAVFRGVGRGGRIAQRALTGKSIADVVKRRAADVGLDPREFAGHSLRSGFVTEGFRRDVDPSKIQRQTGHARIDTVRIYQRESAPLTGNAVTDVGL
ncbi:MAG: tyrosine-type recombinase/integrase [Phycicoccus sp.]